MMRPAALVQGNEPWRAQAKQDTDFSVQGIIGSQQVSTVQNNYPNIHLPSHQTPSDNNRKNHSTKYEFTMADLLQFFFGKSRFKIVENEAVFSGKSVDMPPVTDQCGKSVQSKANEIGCGVCQQETSDECPMHGPVHSLRKLVKAEHCIPRMREKIRLTYAVTSFPPEVQLCESSVPGHCYGVCARQFIPVGTWIGPYEGVRLGTSEIRPETDMSYMWEIYENGQITSFLDGRDENISSWMRFIRCARHKLEQNLFAFQYGGNIYYRAFKDISPGAELLVWYDDHYEQFLGIPIGLREVGPASTGHLFPQDFDRVTSNFNPTYPSSSHVPYTQPLHCDTKQRPVTITRSDVDSKSPTVEPQPLTQSTQHVEETTDTKPTNHRCSDSPNSEHLETGIWRCGQCFKSFTQRSLLQIHVCPRSPEKPYQCGHCAQSFSHPTDLRTHVVTHNSERPFKCGFCGRSFAGSTTLNNHIRTHTGEKPFVCEKCARPFSQASQLSRHQRLPGDCHRNNVF